MRGERSLLVQRLTAGKSSAHEPNLQQNAFYQMVRRAISALPWSGTKRERVLHQTENWVVSAQRQLQESMAAGATDEQILDVGASFQRAVRQMVLQRQSARQQADLVGAILRETAANSFENMAGLDMLTNESLTTLDVAWKAARVQRDASQALMDAIDQRTLELSRPNAA